MNGNDDEPAQGNLAKMEVGFVSMVPSIHARQLLLLHLTLMESLSMENCSGCCGLVGWLWTGFKLTSSWIKSRNSYFSYLRGEPLPVWHSNDSWWPPSERTTWLQPESSTWKPNLKGKVQQFVWERHLVLESVMIIIRLWTLSRLLTDANNHIRLIIERTMNQKIDKVAWCIFLDPTNSIRRKGLDQLMRDRISQDLARNRESSITPAFHKCTLRTDATLNDDQKKGSFHFIIQLETKLKRKREKDESPQKAIAVCHNHSLFKTLERQYTTFVKHKSTFDQIILSKKVLYDKYYNENLLSSD